MFVETIEAVSTGLGVIEISEKVFPTFKKFLNLIKNGQISIAIFGAGGTGKTTLGKILAGKLALTDLFQPYHESIMIEKYNLEGGTVGSVIVAPGQERRQDNWDELLRALAVGKFKLIINVVAWGYHSFGSLSYKQHKLYKDGMTIDEFMDKYSEEFRKRELDVLRKIEPHLSISKQKKTILVTLVGKQDLWWDKRKIVHDYYVSGEYEDLIQEIRNKRGSTNFIHEYSSTSLVMENMVSGANELLLPTTQGYDQRLKLTNFRNFLYTMENLLEFPLKMLEG